MPVPGPAFRRLVARFAEPHTVHRRDDTTSSSYGQGITYTELTDSREVCIVGTGEVQQMMGAGERQAENIVAYTESGVDLQLNDRIDHGSETYEVITKAGKPDESNPAIYRYELDNDF